MLRSRTVMCRKHHQHLLRPLFWNGFFRDNFVVDRKEWHFWNRWFFSMCVSCKFSIFVMVTWPLFGTLPGPISAKCLVILSRLAKGTPSESLGFPPVPLVWGKTVSCRLCTGQSKGTLKTQKKFTIVSILTSALTICCRNRGDPSSLYRT